MSEDKLSAKFQAFAEADDTSPAVESLLRKANEQRVPLLEYIDETDQRSARYLIG